MQWAGPARWAGSVSGQLPPRKIAPRRIAPYIIASQTIAPGDNCPRGKLPPYNYTPGRLLLDYCSRKNYSKDNYPLTIAPGNSHRGKLPFGWFVVYIIPPRKTAPRARKEKTCIRKNFIKWDWNGLKKKNMSRTNWEWNIETELFMLL